MCLRRKFQRQWWVLFNEMLITSALHTMFVEKTQTLKGDSHKKKNVKKILKYLN